MSETKTVLTGLEMFEIRKHALDSSIHVNSSHNLSSGADMQIGKVLYDASAFLNFLINGMPADEVPGSISASKPNTPEVLAAANAPAAETKKKTTKAALSVVKTDTPAVTTTAQPAAAVAPGAGASHTPNVIASPTTMAAAAESLKALVQNDARGIAAGAVNGREAAIAILAKFGVTQLAQIPAPKLAEFKAALDAAGNAGTPITAADPTGGLL